MSKRRIEDYVNGAESLPEGFTTGYAKDLEVAREIIRGRQGLVAKKGTPEPRPPAANRKMEFQAG